LTPLLTGLGLAAAAGFNGWAVLLLFNGLYRVLPLGFPGPLAAFLASPSMFDLALVMFLLEFVADKIPFVDRFWDAAHTLLRPAIGFALAMASVDEWTLASRLGVGLGGAAATLATHVAKSTSRLTSTAALRFGSQFAMSIAEDLLAVVLATLMFFEPRITVVFLGALAISLVTHWPRVRRALTILFFRIQHPRSKPKTEPKPETLG
jgi:hypothetical protein